MSVVMAKWGKMKWLINSKKLLTIEDDLAIKYGINDKNKKEKIEISFSYTPNSASGVNVNTEINRWKSLVGKSNPLYIGKKRFGPKSLKLKSAEVTDIQIYGKGIKLSAAIALTFIENKKKSKKTSKKNKKSKKSKAKKTKVKKSKSK